MPFLRYRKQSDAGLLYGDNRPEADMQLNQKQPQTEPLLNAIINTVESSAITNKTYGYVFGESINADAISNEQPVQA